MKIKGGKTDLWNVLLFLGLAVVLTGAGIEFFNIAWGTGVQLGQFSFRWALLFFLFVLAEVICLSGTAIAVWNPQRNLQLHHFLTGLRRRIGIFRWALAIIVLLAPVWFLQYTTWGVVFSHPYSRLLIWCIAIVLLAFFLSVDAERGWTWQGTLTAVLLTGASFVLTVPFMQVTNYPFSLGWSEGNRLWDYSVLFGRSLYDYPGNRPYKAFLDLGRQLVGGIPFLLPHVSIGMERFWIGLTNTIPYLLTGWITFAHTQKNTKFWILAGLWSFMFLNQGPIHAPLVISAVLVALAWDRPLWLAIPLVLVSGYFAVTGRFTWLLAPGMWAGMLEVGGAALMHGKISRLSWIRSIAIGLAGVFGGYGAPYVISLLTRAHPLSVGNVPLASTVTTTLVTSAVTHQPFLWYRLLPNSTYGYGILIGSLIAIGPLVCILTYLVLKGHWSLNLWQKLGILLPLLAFLVVGLIASTKIGGGGDLHNTDMFLIGVLFAAAIFFKQAGEHWAAAFEQAPRWMMAVVFMAVMIPGYPALMTLRPISFANAIPRLITLTDSGPQGKSLGSLPADEKVQADLLEIQKAVASEQIKGEVLFMDQRQLLTFGFVKGVALVPDYDKKLLIDQAMSSNEAYFQQFYKDLAAHRFSLIISDRLRTPIRDNEYGFSEENNDWVKWVARPVLCYYEEKDTLTDVGVELLVPQQGAVDCSNVLP
jgi:hypothetical protein